MVLSLHKRSSSRCARGTCGRKGSGGAREGEERDGSSLVRPSLCTFSSELRSDVNYPLSNHRSPGTLDGGRGRRVRTERPRPAAPRREPRSGAGQARGSDETLSEDHARRERWAGTRTVLSSTYSGLKIPFRDSSPKMVLSSSSHSRLSSDNYSSVLVHPHEDVRTGKQGVSS